MAEKLGPGDNFLDMTLSLDSGGGVVRVRFPAKNSIMIPIMIHCEFA